MKDSYRFTYVDAVGTTTIKEGAGSLHRIIIGTTSAGKIEVYDGVDGGVYTMLSELKASIAEGSLEFNCNFANGLYLTNPSGSKITVVWR